MQSDIAEALDEGSMTALIMLNLSAAFDVINHPIILNCLEFSFGTKEKALTLGKVVPHREIKLLYVYQTSW